MTAGSAEQAPCFLCSTPFQNYGITDGFPTGDTIIRSNPNIKGIIVKNTEIKLCQHADDTTLTLDGSKKSFQEALSMLETFGHVSGLRLNKLLQKDRSFLGRLNV